MRRFQLGELHEQPWLPSCIREGVTESLSFLHRISGFYRKASKILFSWSRNLSSGDVLELGSGTGNSSREMAAALARKKKRTPRICLSDLYPYTEQYKKHREQFPDVFTYEETPVDALHADVHRGTGIMICDAFHHFSPDQARKIVLNAQKKAEGLLIFETMERRLYWIFACLFCTLVVIPVSSLFIFPSSLRKLVFTLMIPVIPIVMAIDGVVSVFRMYTGEELADLTGQTGRNDFKWETGTVRYCMFLQGTYCMGLRTDMTIMPE